MRPAELVALEPTGRDASSAASRPAARMRPRGQWRLHLLLVPCFVLIVGLVLYPMAQALYGSFHVDSPLKHTTGFVGFKNYEFVLSDPAFIQAVENSARYLLFVTVLSLIIGLVLAVWLHRLRHARSLGVIVVLLPWAVPGTVVGVLWQFILEPTGSGLLNSILLRMHLISDPIVWLSSPLAGIALISLSLVWQTVPIAALILYAGLASLPSELSESARIDGAGPVSEFFHVTLPLLRPALAISMLNAGILAIGLYDQMYVLAGYAPATMTVVGHIYLASFHDFNFGIGIAASVFVMLGTIVVSLFYLKVVYREVNFT